MSPKPRGRHRRRHPQYRRAKLANDRRAIAPRRESQRPRAPRCPRAAVAGDALYNRVGAPDTYHVTGTLKMHIMSPEPMSPEPKDAHHVTGTAVDACNLCTRPRLGNPVDKNDEGIVDPVSHLVGYKIRGPAKPKTKAPNRRLRMGNQPVRNDRRRYRQGGPAAGSSGQERGMLRRALRGGRRRSFQVLSGRGCCGDARV